MKQINQLQLIALIASLNSRGATPAELHTLTVPKMNKTGNPYFGNAQKCSAVNVMFGANYENGVNRRLKKQGTTPADFIASTSWYGRHNGLSTIVEHKTKGDLYARAVLNTQNKPTVSYQTLGGDEIPTDDISPYVNKRRASARQEDAGLEKEKQVFPTVWKIDSIKAITVLGETYVVNKE
jgi:hypothetical protein